MLPNRSRRPPGTKTRPREAKSDQVSAMSDGYHGTGSAFKERAASISSVCNHEESSKPGERSGSARTTRNNNARVTRAARA